MQLRDTITGFTGICMYRTQWIHGCNVYGLQPTALNKDGGVQERQQFDEPQLEEVPKLIKNSKKSSRTTGGPHDMMKEVNRV